MRFNKCFGQLESISIHASISPVENQLKISSLSQCFSDWLVGLFQREIERGRINTMTDKRIPSDRQNSTQTKRQIRRREPTKRPKIKMCAYKIIQLENSGAKGRADCKKTREIYRLPAKLLNKSTKFTVCLERNANSLNFRQIYDDFSLVFFLLLFECS